ncbi:MAG: Hsp20/alpha crystallin family protein [Phycisphaerae bacterium]|nr:Hsp20/alpha crystallin family protein [Phycisphaerae bacterium]
MQAQIIRASGFDQFSSQINAFVDEILGRQYVRYCPTDAWQPHVNVYETPEAFIVCVDLAGTKAEEVRVETQSDALVIRGKRTPPIPAEAQTADIRVHLMEIDHGEFCRSVELQNRVDAERIDARYVDGLLWITLPKRA